MPDSHRAASVVGRDDDGNDDLDSLKRQVEDYERWFRTLDNQICVLERERQKFSALTKYTDAGIVLLDAGSRVVWANDSFITRFSDQRSTRKDPLGASCHEVLCRKNERCKECPSAKVFKVMRQRIEAARNSKTLRWYYLCDEPECRGVSPVYLKYQYDFIKKLDPYHPVMIITREPARFTGCADILNPHPYLTPTVNAKGVRRMRSPKRIRDQMRTVLAAGKGRIPAWLTPQAFSYGFVDPQADYPTFVEYRCMLWDAVANGATGFTPFMYAAHFGSPDLRIGCDFVYESMAYLDDFLNSAERPMSLTVEAPQDGVDAWAKKIDGKVLLVAVNLLDKPVTATIHVPGLDDVSELYGFREKADVKLAKGQLTLKFSPYQVHLLTHSKIAQQLRTVLDANREIAAARAAMKKPGNILFGRGKEIVLRVLR